MAWVRLSLRSAGMTCEECNDIAGAEDIDCDRYAEPSLLRR